MAYCEQEQLTFTRGRPGVKNDQCHVEQKNGAVVRKAVGCARLIGAQAYQQLREVYRALRLMVNCFQPSLKLQAKVYQGERVRRVYDIAQTPLQRLLASGVLSEDRQRDLREWVEQIDPLALSEHLDAFRYALLCGADGACLAPARSLLWALCTSVPLPAFEEEPERTGHREAPSSGKEMGHPALERAVAAPMETLLHGPGTIHPSGRSLWEESWPAERIRGGHVEPDLPEAVVSCADQYAVQAQPLPTSAMGTAEQQHQGARGRASCPDHH